MSCVTAWGSQVNGISVPALYFRCATADGLQMDKKMTRNTSEKMNTKADIAAYISGLPDVKQQDMATLHELASRISAGKRLWFFDGKDANDKTVSNPTIGYGLYTIRYANGSTREFFRVGISANSTGISVHIMGIKDKTFLQQTYGNELGKATVTGYCIKFRKLQDIHIEVLEAAMQYAFTLR